LSVQQRGITLEATISSLALLLQTLFLEATKSFFAG